METTAEQIKRLEQELAALKEKERVEREEAKIKAKQEFESDIKKLIEEHINEFNCKHGDSLYLARKYKRLNNFYDSSAEQIKKLEQELAALKEKERVEREDAKIKAKQEFESDVRKLEEHINEFNRKHGDSLYLARKYKSLNNFADVFINW